MAEKKVILNAVKPEELGTVLKKKESYAIEIMNRLQKLRETYRLPACSPRRYEPNWEEYHESNRERLANTPVIIYIEEVEPSPLYNLVYPESMLKPKIKH